MRHLIVSTCGTSVLTWDAAPPVSAVLVRTANASEQEIDRVERDAIDEWRLRQEERILSAPIETVRRMSAECNALLSFYDNRLSTGIRDQHILLHSDTYQGHHAGQVIGGYLRQGNIDAREQCVPKLNTAHLEAFQNGLKELVGWCEETLTGYRVAGYRIIFNLAGGFKAFQGFMQTLGMFYADEMIYIFEGSDQLLRIPRLPVQFEEALVACLRKNLPLFRRLARPQASVSCKVVTEIPDTLLLIRNKTAELSLWGRLVWERNQKAIYRSEIFDSPTEQLEISSRVREIASRFSPEMKERFNRKIDDLAFYLDSGRKFGLNGLDFKQLRGSSKLGVTHEFDLWHDGGAWRGFGRFERGIFWLDWIGEGIH